MIAPAALRVSEDLTLPLDAVTGTFGILATKGAGKSNAAVVMAEEMWDAGVPWVAVDPKGDWYGIRSSSDGRGPGLPIVVFGGRHGDVPLEATGGHLLADLVLRQRLTCVLDVSQFTKAETVRFLRDFGDHLFRHADDDGAEPIHLFLEEAHEYLPQQVSGDVAHLVSVWQRIVKQGRFKGLGATMISQRSSSLNKDVLELVDTLIVLRTVGPRSRDAIKAWVKDQDVDEGLLASLPSLKDGEAWVWSPGELGLMERIRFRRRRTFDSGSTPKVGQSRRPPATLADVDLAAIKEQMADTIEKAQAEDPKILRARIAELERKLAAAERTTPESVVERVEVPVLDAGLVARVEQVYAGLRDHGREFIEIADKLSDNLGLARDAKHLIEKTRLQRPDVSPGPALARHVRPAAAGEGEVHLKAGARRILETLARHHPMKVTRAQVGTLTGFKVSGGTFQTYWSVLKRAGYIDEEGGEISVTDAGLAAAGVEAATPLTTAELLDQWRRALKKGAREMLDVLVDRYPEGLTRDELATAVGMTATGGTFQTYLSTLRRNGLADVGHDIRASDTLFISGRA